MKEGDCPTTAPSDWMTGVSLPSPQWGQATAHTVDLLSHGMEEADGSISQTPYYREELNNTCGSCKHIRNVIVRKII